MSLYNNAVVGPVALLALAVSACAPEPSLALEDDGFPQTSRLVSSADDASDPTARIQRALSNARVRCGFESTSLARGRAYDQAHQGYLRVSQLPGVRADFLELHAVMLEAEVARDCQVDADHTSGLLRTRGSATLGAACVTGHQCASGVCDGAEWGTETCGVCTPGREEGAFCTPGLEDACALPLRCGSLQNASKDGPFGTCTSRTAAGKRGQACGFGALCEAGSYCDTPRDGVSTCVLKKSFGAKCSVGECRVGARCAPHKERENATCETIPALGDLCDVRAPVCSNGALCDLKQERCIDGTQDIAVGQPCALGLFQQRACARGSHCASLGPDEVSLCTPDRAAGEPISFSKFECGVDMHGSVDMKDCIPNRVLPACLVP